MNPELSSLVVAVCILGVAYLCGHVHGFYRGCKSSLELAEREQAREKVLERIRNANADSFTLSGGLVFPRGWERDPDGPSYDGLISIQRK